MKSILLGAHLPWAQIDTSLDLVFDLGLVPEVAIKGPELDPLDKALVSRVSNRLATAGVRPTVHAPFFDLNPGALDPLIRRASVERLEQTLRFAGTLNASLVVVHPGFDKWRYPNLDQVWLAHATDSFALLVGRAADCGCRLAIENIYEETPYTLVRLVEELASDWLGHCFDVGHWHLFGKRPMPEWLEAIGARLFHLHLHDNHGRADEHLPLGEGTIDFTPLRQKLRRMPDLPSMTLEAHSREHLERSLAHFEKVLT